MNNEDLTEGGALLKVLHVVNAHNEKAEDSELLVNFADEALRELHDRDAYAVIKRVTDLLSELARFKPNNEAIYQSREMADAWRSELVAILDDLVQFDLRATRYDVPTGHFYYNDSAIRSSIQRAVGMLSAYSMPDEAIEQLIRKELAGEDNTHEALLTWVFQLLHERPSQTDYSGIVGSVPQFDRPKGGGNRKEHNIALAHACRRLNAVLPEFYKCQWAFQAKLLMWAGFGKVERNHVERAVIGNRRRL